MFLDSAAITTNVWSVNVKYKWKCVAITVDDGKNNVVGGGGQYSILVFHVLRVLAVGSVDLTFAIVPHQYVRVMLAGGQCYEPGPFFSTIPRHITRVGIRKRRNLLLRPDWLVTGGLLFGAALILCLCVIVLVGTILTKMFGLFSFGGQFQGEPKMHYYLYS